MATATKLSPGEIAQQLERQPLIGVMAAAELLGIKAPNFRRDAAKRLTAIPVEGSASVYFRSEVEELAAQRAAKRVSQNGAH